MSTVLGRGRRFRVHGFLLSHRLALECQTIAVVHESIEDRIGERRIGEIGVPLIDRQLARDNRLTPVVAVIQNLQQITLGLFAHRHEAEVIEHQQFRLGELLQEAGAVLQCMIARQFIDEPR